MEQVEDRQGRSGWNCQNCGTFVSINYIRCACCDAWRAHEENTEQIKAEKFSKQGLDKEN